MGRDCNAKRFVVVGQANVGKTLFALRFAEYLGARSIVIRRAEGDGVERRLVYSAEGARRELVSEVPHQTLAAHSLVLEVRSGKAVRPLTMIDTPGLADHIDQRQEVRRAMAASLRLLYEADVVVHLVDASRAGAPGTAAAPGIPGEIDYQIARFARFRPGYVILANKMDLPAAALGLKALRETFAGDYLVPISALKSTGFDEVKAFVRRHL
ncbi:MAG TPA: GTPase [Bacillota bacterium]